MTIEQIDKNFAKQEVEIKDGKATYRLPYEKFSLFGLQYDRDNKRFTRLPDAVAKATSVNVTALATNTAGGRLCFKTNSPFIELSAKYPALCNMRHMPLTGSSGFSLFENTPNGEKLVGILNAYPADQQGFSSVCALNGDALREYILYFPLYNDIYQLTIALDEKAKVQPFNPYQDKLPILYYGSSITQGGCASRPDNSYQAIICKKNRIDYINLGFSGSAKGEKAMAEYLSKIPCSIFVCDYDHNAQTPEDLQNTHYPLYETFRKANPKTPILFLTRPDYKTVDDEKRIEIVKATYEKAKVQGDKKVYFISGKTFFQGGQVCDYTVDNCHPTDHGFAAMADKIYPVIQEILEGEHYD